MDDDKTLVEAVLANQPRAFEQLVRKHQRLVFGMVFRMVNDAHDTEELCQDVFMRVHRYLPQFRFDSQLSTWIGQIAFSVAGRHLQRKRIPLLSRDDSDVDPLEHVADGIDLEGLLISADLGRHVDAALQALSPIQRTLITLYHLEELSIAEIATVTGQPEGTVKNYLFRARAALKKTLSPTLEMAA